MYSQPEDIMENYDLTVEQVTKGRGTFICSTSQGMKLLIPFNGSEERAKFLREFLQYIQSNGFPVEQITPTAEGKMLAEDDAGKKYLLKDMIAGSECSTRNWEEMSEAARLLARYHTCARQCPLEIPEIFAGAAGDRVLCYQKRIRELILVKNYVRTRKKKNEFEQKFAQHYPHFIARANEALRLLEQEEYVEDTRLFCHGDFNQHNILHTHEGYRIVNFEHLTYDIPMSDLANFLRKMLEKNNWKEDLGVELIDAYDRIHPLNSGERLQLYIMLQFPEKFWKIANHYSNSHKAWLSGRDLEKLDKVIAQEPAKERFLQQLFHA